MVVLKDNAIVLRVAHYRDRDLMLSFLTKDNGRISACARGARGSSKRFSGGIDLFDCANITLDKKNNLENFTRVETWSNLVRAPKLFAISSACIEAVLHITKDQDSDAKELFMPLFLTLRTLNSADSIDQQKSIMIFFLYTTLQVTGFGLPENINSEVEQWQQAMHNTNTPIVPNNRDLIELALNDIRTQFKEITEKDLSSIILIGNENSRSVSPGGTTNTSRK